MRPSDAGRAGPKKRRAKVKPAKPVRGPQGLPTAASSPQRRAPKPKPAPRPGIGAAAGRKVGKPKPKRPAGTRTVFDRPITEDFGKKGKPAVVRQAKVAAIKRENREAATRPDTSLKVVPTLSKAALLRNPEALAATLAADRENTKRIARRHGVDTNAVSASDVSEELRKLQALGHSDSRDLTRSVQSPRESEPFDRAATLAREIDRVLGRDRIRPKAPPPKKSTGAKIINIATIGPKLAGTSWQKQFNKQLAAITGGDSADTSARVLRNAARDVVDMPANAVTSTYMTAAAAVEAARGNPERAKRLIDEYVHGDPIALAAQGKFKEATKAAEEHPVYTGLELSGVKGAIGRSTGATMRSGVLGKTAKRAGSTKRAPLKLYGDLTEPRSYSRDAITKGLQVLGERSKRKRGLDPDQATPQQVAKKTKRRVDEEVAYGNVHFRREREKAARTVQKAEPKRSRKERVAAFVGLPGEKSPEANIVRLSAERIVRAKKDLRDYREQIEQVYREDEFSEPKGPKRRANRELARNIDRALKAAKRGKLDLKAVERSAQAYIDAQRPIQEGLVKAAVIDEGQLKAALVPFARQHMDAGYDASLRKTPEQVRFEGLRDSERQAAKTVRKRRTAVATRSRAAARAEGAAKVRRPQRTPEVRAAERALSDAESTLAALRRGQRVRERGAARSQGRAEVLSGQARTKIRREIAALETTAVRHTEANRHRQAAEVMARRKELIRRLDGSPVRTLNRLERDRAGLLDVEQQIARAERDVGAAKQRLRQAVSNAPRAPRKTLERLERERGKQLVEEQQLARAIKDYERVRDERRKAYVPKDQQRFRAGLVDEDGAPLSARAIRAELEAQGVGEPGYVSQKLNMRGQRSNFYRSGLDRRPTENTGRRTGEATVKGLIDSHYDALVEQAIRSRGVLSAVDNLDRHVQTFGLRKPGRRNGDGTYEPGNFFKDFDEARRYRDGLEGDDFGNLYPDNLDLVPMRIAPLGTTRQRLAQMKTGQLADTATLDSVVDRIPNQIVEAFADGDGPVVLVPSFVRKRLLEHNFTPNSVERAFQSLTQTFKSAVLPTSLKWAFGNVADVYGIRSVSHGLGPVSYARGRRLLRKLEEIDPAAADSLRGRALEGLHYGSAQLTRVHRTADDFEGAVGRFAQAAESLGRKPGVNAVRETWEAYRNGVFRGMAWVERQPQYAALGKQAAREYREFKDSWAAGLRLGDDAMTDLARGLRNTDNQLRYSRFVADVFGNWSKNSPGFRKWILNYAPFGQWFRASGKFVFITLPKDHPIKTGMLAAISQMTEEDREKLGLTMFGENRVPPFLQGSIPTKDGLLRTQSYTSFGIWGDPAGALPSATLPQISALLTIPAGLNWKGNKIKLSNGKDPDQLTLMALAAYSQAEAWVPFLSIARRIREKGGSPRDDSTVFSPKVKKGTEGDLKDALDRILNPARPTGKSNPKKGGGGLDDFLRGGGASSPGTELDDFLNGTKSGGGSGSELDKYLSGAK